jgi:hypothetical protein
MARQVSAAVVCIIVLAMQAKARLAEGQTVTFDFDAGTPPLTAGQTLPLDQTSGGITAHFTGPFSVQSDATTHFILSQFSGNYLYPNTTMDPLTIAFSRPLGSIRLTFATIDFQQNETPTTVQLTAYADPAGTTAVGSATAHGAYGTDTMPMGTLSFASGGQGFQLVQVRIPPAPLAASGFLVDTIAVLPATEPRAPLTVVRPVAPRLPRVIPWRPIR